MRSIGLRTFAIKQFGEIAIHIESILLHLKPLKPFTKNDTDKDLSSNSAHKKARGVQRYTTHLIAEKLVGKWLPLPLRTLHILSYNRGNLPRGQISYTHDGCGYLRVILRS